MQPSSQYPQLKSHSDHYLDLFLVVLNSNHEFKSTKKKNSQPIASCQLGFLIRCNVLFGLFVSSEYLNGKVVN